MTKTGKFTLGVIVFLLVARSLYLAVIPSEDSSAENSSARVEMLEQLEGVTSCFRRSAGHILSLIHI